MSTKASVNRRVLAIQAKKKRYKPTKRKGKGNTQTDNDNTGAHCSKTSARQPQAPDATQDSTGQRPFTTDNGNRYVCICQLFSLNYSLSFFFFFFFFALMNLLKVIIMNFIWIHFCQWLIVWMGLCACVDILLY